MGAQTDATETEKAALEGSVSAGLSADDLAAAPESPSKKKSKKKKSKSSKGGLLGDSVASLSLDDTPQQSPTKKKKKKVKKQGTTLDESAASLISLDASSGELDMSPDDIPQSPTKKKKKVKKQGTTLDESAASLISLDASGELNMSPDSPTNSPNSKKSKKEKTQAADSATRTTGNNNLTPEQELMSKNAGDIIGILTETIWQKGQARAALESLHTLLVLQDNDNNNNEEEQEEDCLKNQKLALRLGAPVLIVRQMKDYDNDDAILSLGLNLLLCFADMPCAPWFELVVAGGLERVTWIVKNKTESNEALATSALLFLLIMTAETDSARYLVAQKHHAGNNKDTTTSGVDALVHVVRNYPQATALMSPALEALRALCGTGGHTGRKVVAEEASLMLMSPEEEDSKQLAVVGLVLLGEMVGNEESAKSLVEGNGVEALAYTLDDFQTNKASTTKKTFETLIALSNHGGALSRTAIVDQGILTTIAEIMKDFPDDVDMQKRSCQVVSPLVTEHRKAVKDAGILPLISKIFSAHPRMDDLLKVAHTAMGGGCHGAARRKKD